MSLLPPKARHYYEPFVGGGALFFALSPKARQSTLSDSNEELVNCYLQVAQHPKALIDCLCKLTHSESNYYRIRKETPSNAMARAVRFIYLNKTCWNGLYRVNDEGTFNVPVGRFERGPIICQPEQILKASSLLEGTKVHCCDFEEAVADADCGDFVYFDPPYVAKHDNNGFKKYNERVFSWNDQERLARLSEDLKQRRVFVMISNSSNDDILNLYEGFYKYFVQRHSVISGLPSGRSLVSEVIMTSYGPPNLRDLPNTWRFD